MVYDRLYGGANLVAGTSLLRAQCALVALLAVNGVTECFARSVMTDAEAIIISSQGLLNRLFLHSRWCWAAKNIDFHSKSCKCESISTFIL